MAADGQSIGVHRSAILGIQRILLDGCGVINGRSAIGDGPLNNIIQVRRTGDSRAALLNAGDLDLVLQVQIAVVADTQRRQLISTTRLPQEFLVRVASLLEL